MGEPLTPEALAAEMEAALAEALKGARVSVTVDAIEATAGTVAYPAQLAAMLWPALDRVLAPAHAALAAERDALATQVATLKGEPPLTGADLIAHALAAEEGHANGAAHDAFGCRPCLLHARARLAKVTAERDAARAQLARVAAVIARYRADDVNALTAFADIMDAVEAPGDHRG